MCVDRRLYQLGVALLYLSIFSSLPIHHDMTVYLNLISVLLRHQLHFASLTQNSMNLFFPSFPSYQLSLVITSFWYNAFSPLSPVSVISSHTPSTLAACHGSFRRSLAAEVIRAPQQSAVTCDEDRRGEVLDKLRREWMRGEESGVRGLVRWSVGHPAVVFCFAAEAVFELSSHLCSQIYTHTHPRTPTH